MTGLKITVPTTFTDATLPKLLDDPVLPINGALALFDLTHPYNPLAAGVPAGGSVIPNLAVESAKALFPAGSTAGLGAVLTLGSTWVSESSVMERTTKGGLHLIPKQATAGTVNRTAKLLLGTNLVDYLKANPAHAYYVSLWGVTTRKTATAWAAAYQTTFMGSGYQVGAFFDRGAGTGGNTIYPSDGRRLGYRTQGGVGAAAADATIKTDLGAFIQNIGVTANGAVDTGGAPSILQVGNFPTATGYSPSKVFYRGYIEDLTVSGRTYAAVDALDYAEYQRQVVNAPVAGVGGRYNGDTWSDPATVAA